MGRFESSVTRAHFLDSAPIKRLFINQRLSVPYLSDNIDLRSRGFGVATFG